MRSTCDATNFRLASCGTMLPKVHPSSDFCNKLSILSYVTSCHTSHRVIGRFTRTKSAGKMLSSRAHLGQLFLRCGTFQDFGHQYLVKDTTFFSEIDKGDMWKENWSARKGHRYRRVTVRFSVVNKSKEGRIKVWR